MQGALDFLARKYVFHYGLDMLQVADKAGQTITAKAAFSKVGATNAILYADGGNNTLNGGIGHDLLIGSRGNDILNGGSGNDTLNGNAGNDILSGSSARFSVRRFRQ